MKTKKKATTTIQQSEVKATYDVKQKTAIASTDAVDRMGEIIDQDGWHLDNFKANPVMLWAHDHTEPAIGTAKNLQLVQIGGKKALTFTPVFHGKTELSAAMDALYNGDPNTGMEPVLNSFSVGFQILNQEGNTITEQELLEISSCNVPANADARTLAYKSMVKRGVTNEIAEKVVGAEKGAVQDELDAEAVFDQKCDNLNSVRDVYWAFLDVYYDDETDVNDFGKLLTEVADIFTQIAAGTYVDPLADDEDDEDGEKSIKVLDRLSQKPKDRGNKAKVKPTAPVVPDKKKKIQRRQARVKIIAKAVDQLLADEKNGGSKDSRVRMAKAIKRSAEYLSKSHKEEINHG